MTDTSTPTDATRPARPRWQRVLRRIGVEAAVLALLAVASVVVLVLAHVTYPGAFVGDTGRLFETLIIAGVVGSAYAIRLDRDRHRHDDDSEPG